MMRTNGSPTLTWITAKWRTIPRLHLGNSTPGNTHSKTKRESTITATNSRARCRWRKDTTSPKRDAVRMKTGTNTWNSPKRKVGVFWHKRTHQMLPSASERNQRCRHSTGQKPDIRSAVVGAMRTMDLEQRERRLRGIQKNKSFV